MATENWLTAGEWLKANTSTGMIIHTDIRKSPAEGTPWNTLRSHVGIRYSVTPSRIRISGYTSHWVTISMIRWPVNITSMSSATRMPESSQRGGDAMPSWLTMRLSTVLVMLTP